MDHMKGAVIRLAAEYGAAMRDYLTGHGEAALKRAYEIGRRALAEGMGVLEMAAAHQSAAIAALPARSIENVNQEQGNHEHVNQGLLQALTCFSESLAPFEMVLR